jgi:hypothetical protein
MLPPLLLPLLLHCRCHRQTAATKLLPLSCKLPLPLRRCQAAAVVTTADTHAEIKHYT